MKHIRIAIAVLALGFLNGAACSLIAQEKASPKYDVASQQTVEGTILGVKDYECPVTGTLGFHITIKASGGTFEVHVAPTKSLKDYGMELQVGDTVKIVGVKFTYEGHPAMLAKELTAGQATYIFRDDKGRPIW
jgi:hypothetical protein